MNHFPHTGLILFDIPPLSLHDDFDFIKVLKNPQGVQYWRLTGVNDTSEKLVGGHEKRKKLKTPWHGPFQFLKQCSAHEMRSIIDFIPKNVKKKSSLVCREDFLWLPCNN